MAGAGGGGLGFGEEERAARAGRAGPAGHPLTGARRAGELEIVAGDGERRRFGPGSVYLSSDTTGEGHESLVVSAGDCQLAIIPLIE